MLSRVLIFFKYDNSEEERTCEREEGFVQVEVERPIDVNKVVVNGKSLRFKVMGSKGKKEIKSPRKVNMFVSASVLGDSSKRNTNNVESQDVDCDSEDLESSDPDVSDNKKQRKSKYGKFIADLLNKDFQFKLGM